MESGGSGEQELGLRVALLLDDVEVDGVDDDVALDVDAEGVSPEEDPRRADDVDGGAERHLPAGGGGEQRLGVVGELEAGEARGEAEDAARGGLQRAGQDLGGAEQGAVVEDGEGRRRVADGGGVGVGDMDGEDELHVQQGEIELEGGELDGDQVEGGVPGSAVDHGGDGRRRRRADRGGGPVPSQHLLASGRRARTSAAQRR